MERAQAISAYMKDTMDKVRGTALQLHVRNNGKTIGGTSHREYGEGLQERDDKALEGMGCLFENIIGGLVDQMGGLLQDMMGKVTGALDCIVNDVIGGMLDSALGAINDVADGITGAVDGVLGSVQGAISGVTGALTV